MLRSEDVTSPEASGAVQAARVQRLVALTNDAPLIRALQELSVGGVNVSVVPDMRSLTDVLLQNAGDTVLIDTASLDAPVTEVVDAISRQLPDLCLMVAGHSTDQTQLTSRLANRTVFRFVHKPASPQRLKLILDSAARVPAPAVTVSAATTSVTKILAEPLSAGGSKLPRRALLTGLAVLVAVAMATWLFWPKNGAVPEAAAPPANAGAIISQPQAGPLLAQADAAFAAGRFVASDGSSAAELYRAALKLEAGNRRGREGFDKSIDQSLHRAEEAMLAGKLNEASSLAAAVALISPDNPRLGFLNTQIAREQARLNTDASQRQAYEARQTRIAASLTAMKERVQRGALIEPSANAVASFREAEAIGANENSVHAARETLVAALLTAADTELGARKLPAARRLVDAARSINSNAPGIDVLMRRVDEVTAQLANPEPPPAPATRAETTAPVATAPAPAPTPVVAAPVVAAPVAPAPASASANTVVSAKSLKLLRGQDPVYPPWALEQLISGWVEMEFTVATDGTVKDIKVTASQPKNTFNSAATSALARHRYEPVQRDGVVVAQRANIRMRFTAQDGR